jgi:hypothetical protein
MTAFLWLAPAAADAGYARTMTARYLFLIVLIGVMTWLGVRHGRYRRVDQRCRYLTYPLYVYHRAAKPFALPAPIRVRA